MQVQRASISGTCPPLLPPLGAGLGAAAAGAGFGLGLKSGGGCPAEQSVEAPETGALAALWHSHPAQSPQALPSPKRPLLVSRA